MATLNAKQATNILKEKVQKEYDIGKAHIQSDHEHKRDILKQVIFQSQKNGVIRVNLLWKNIKAEHALYLADKPIVTFISQGGILSDATMKNANEVIAFDNDDMNMRETRQTLIWHNGLYGVACTVISEYDTENEQPIHEIIHPMNIVPDPKNYTGSKMRFCGFVRRVAVESLSNNEAYSIPAGVKLSGNKEYSASQVEIAEKWEKDNDDGLCDVYDHFTTYNGRKYLTTWIHDRSVCIRCVDLGELSEKEKKKPSEISYPFQIHRRHPRYGSFFGVSIADEVLQFQDPISVLLNLRYKQARLAALWPDKFISSALWVDIATISRQEIGGRIIRVQPVNGSVGNHIYYDQQPNPSQFPAQMVQELENRVETETGKTGLVFGQSLPGSQTKAEVQELMQNSNQLLSLVANNYLEGEKEFWQAHYEAYVLYMWARRSKVIATYKKQSSVAKKLKKKEFVDEKFIVFVESKNEIKKQNERDFAKLNSVANLVIGNMQPWYSMNAFLRKMLETLDVYELDPRDYITETPDEMSARMRLELLNNNIPVADPEEWEDYMTYIEIYKQALDNEASREAIAKYQEAYMKTPKIQMEGNTDPTTAAMAMNTVNSNLTELW